MRYTIHLRNRLTGEVRAYEDDYEWSDESSMLFQYFDGNYGCDCNRSRFLYDWDADRIMDCRPAFEENTIVIDRITREDGTDVPLDEWKPV